MEEKYVLYRLRVTFRYGTDISEAITKDLLFEFKKEAELERLQIKRKFPSAEFSLAEVTTKKMPI